MNKLNEQMKYLELFPKEEVTKSDFREIQVYSTAFCLGQTFFISWFTDIFWLSSMSGFGIKIKIKCR